MHASLLSAVDCWYSGVLSKRLIVDETPDNPKMSDQDDKEDASTRRNSIVGGCQQFGQQCADMPRLATEHQPSSTFLGLWSTKLVSTGLRACN